MDWFRWHHGTISDPKFRVVAQRCNATKRHETSVTVGETIAVFAAMLERASQASQRGSIDGWDDEDVGVALDMDGSRVETIRQAMQGKVLDGNRLTGWENRQPRRERPADDSTERVRAFRERNKERDTALHDAETPCNATKRTDKREEIEKKEQEHVQRAARFAEFWQAYPSKKGRKPALEKWQSKQLDTIAEAIIEDVKARTSQDRSWLDGYVPNPATYLHQERWTDEIQQRANGAAHPAAAADKPSVAGSRRLA